MRHEWCLEDELPSPQELMPLTQSLITPTLALAFNITTTIDDSPEQTTTENNNNNESAAARTLKRPRLVWTPQLHKRFVDAVANLGIKNAVPKTIMQLMSVDGLTRENVASHLQKYRLYLKRMQNMDRGLVVNNSPSDAAMDRLFASSPVPPQFLRPNSDHFMPPAFVPVQMQQQFRRFEGGNGNSGYEIPFMRQQQVLVGRGGGNGSGGQQQQTVYVEDLESGGRGFLRCFRLGD